MHSSLLLEEGAYLQEHAYPLVPPNQIADYSGPNQSVRTMPLALWPLEN